MNIIPYGKNILVVPSKKKKILVSDTNAIEAYGDVVAIGEDVKTVKVGDTILFTKWGIRENKIGDETFYFVKEDDDFYLGKVCTEEHSA